MVSLVWFCSSGLVKKQEKNICVGDGEGRGISCCFHKHKIKLKTYLM